MGTKTGLWRGRDYRLQLAGAVISVLGSSAAPVATAFAILDAGGSEIGRASGRESGEDEVVPVKAKNKQK
ncbi:hypothetical protein CFP75_44000, partial [Amycolatopsis alba DSM 44262]